MMGEDCAGLCVVSCTEFCISCFACSSFPGIGNRPFGQMFLLTGELLQWGPAHKRYPVQVSSGTAPSTEVECITGGCLGH